MLPVKTIEEYVEEQQKIKQYRHQWNTEYMNPIDIDIRQVQTSAWFLINPGERYPNLQKLNYQSLFINQWSPKEKSKFIESMILRIPMEPIWVAELEDNEFILLDGHQRIETLKYFIQGNGVITGWEYFKIYNDIIKYHQLERHIQRRVEETDFTVNVIRKGTPLSTIYNILSRINPKYLMG